MEKGERFNRFKLALSAAFVDLKESLDLLPNQEDTSKSADLIRNGIIQKFEITIELLWKTTRWYILEVDGEERSSPRSTFKALYSFNHLDEESYNALYELVDWRNKLSHVYHAPLLDQALQYIPNCLPLIKRVIKIIGSETSG